MLVQFLFLAIFAIALIVVWKRATESVISVREAVAWSVLWVAGSIVVVAPQTTTLVANLFGVGRGADFVLYASVLILFLMMLRMMIAMDRLERKLGKIVTEIAMNDLKKHT